MTTTNEPTTDDKLDTAALAALLDDIPFALAQAAHSGTSFVPERRAHQERDDYARQLASDFAALRTMTPPEMAEQLAEHLERYRAGYRKRFVAYLSAKGRCVSPMIAGPSNFPVRRAEKASRSERSRADDLTEYRRRALAAIRRSLFPRPGGEIRTSDADGAEQYRARIAQAEASQALMKATNAAIRRHAKAGPAAMVAALVALGHPERIAAELVTPGRFGGMGFPSYRLTNNAANIRRMKARAAQCERAQAAPVVARESASGVRLEDDPPANRVRLFFPGKPDDATRETLKRRGFRWTPSLGCWQAFRNTWSLDVAQGLAS